jgi:uncharacterized protein (TIGR03083 family)
VGELSTQRYTAALQEQADGLAALVASADLCRPVPTCPEWDLRQLVSHVGQVHRFAADAVRRRVSEPAEATDPASIPVPGEPTELAGWLTTGARELIDAVRAAGVGAPVWNYLGVNPCAGFYLRRMAHETAVHRADAAFTMGEPFHLDPDLAADAISEWLWLITSSGVAAYRPEIAQAMRGEGQTLHLHATDSAEFGASGEWLIRRDPDGANWEHGHQKADVAVRGPAGDLLLALLGRIPASDERIDVLGEAALFDHWVRHVSV